ncbi:MAG: hypothetical protein FJ291_03100 [Planctomycetes bacterium]|nr:hypothetical protein [Planctomycetota bacterium]
MPDPRESLCSGCGTTLTLAPDARATCPKCGLDTRIPGTHDPTPPLAQPTATLPDGAAPTVALADAPAGRPAPAPERTGELSLPRYEEQEVIGHGGMGEVVLCVDRDIHRQIALKRMRETPDAKPSDRARFVEEAQVTGQLEHPNIVPIYELSRDPEGGVYYTMKLVRGRSLAEILKDIKDHRDHKDDRGARDSAGGTGVPPVGQRQDACATKEISLGDLLQMFLKVCDGVAFAHSRGVIHRDLKPANIMVGDYGEVLVMDWGLARILRPDDRRQMTDDSGQRVESHASRVTRQESPPQIASDRQEMSALETLAGSMLGTPAYMSPEQAKGELDKIDARSDLWSLGAILYEILTLERAFAGETTYAILASVLKGNIVPPEQRAPSRNVPRELSAIVMKCLSRTRACRYASVLDLKRDLTLFLEGRSVSAAPDTFAQAFVKLIKRNKAVSAAIALALSVLSVLSVLFVTRLARERDRAVASEGRAITNEKAAITAREKQVKDALKASEVLAYQAIRAAEEGRFTEAEARAEAARIFLPDGPWGYYALAQIAMQRQDKATARKQLDEALRRDPTHEQSRAALAQLLGAAGEADKLRALVASAGKAGDWRALLAAADALVAAGGSEGLAAYENALALMEKDPTVERKVLDEKKDTHFYVRAKALSAGFYDSIRRLPVEEQRRRIAAKFSEIHGTPINPTFTVDKGAIVGLSLQQQPVRSLEPLRGMPLRYLNCAGTHVGDLRALRGMPLETLFCGGPVNVLAGKIADLAPLEGMPLEELMVAVCQVEDIRPLKGLPLARLRLEFLPVRDLTPLRGMRLETLSVRYCRRIRHLDPLQGMPLTTLDCDSTGVADLGPLKGMRLRSLNCGSTGVADLRALKGMPLRSLNCGSTRVSDLDPLRGMTLTTLDCSGTSVSDLSPLRGIPLTCLECEGAPLKDLLPLKGMPLTTLHCATPGVADLCPLDGMKLETLSFSPNRITKGLDLIRAMKTLRRIGRQRHYLHGADDFWKRYDAGEFSK